MIKSRINSHRFSFFYKNDLKRIYTRKPGLLKLLTSFFEDDSLLDVNYFSMNGFKVGKPFINANLYNSNSSTIASQHFYPSVDQYRLLNFFKEGEADMSLDSELNIKRIRFKPGYQRIWRRARSALNYTMKFNYRYQIGLTKRLMRIRRVRRGTSLRMQELKLDNILLSSQFVFDHASSNHLINSGVVFVNGVISRNPRLNMFVGDFIQLITHLRYYIVYR